MVGAARSRTSPAGIAKIAMPKYRADTLRRARLVGALGNIVDHRLYLVVAPPGYGKTTLLVDFASDSEIPVCCYSLKPADADPALFLDSLVSVIRGHFPRFGGETRRVLAEAIFGGDTLAIVEALAKDVDERAPGPFAVVLDDYHEVNHSVAINHLVDALLEHGPDNFKLIISSRTMPKLQLSRLAAFRQAAGIGAKDLRFTAREVRDVMRATYHMAAPDRVVEELTARSEGWITGIVLTTQTMWQGLFESKIRKAGHEQLYGRLANDIFGRQTLAVQRFLLASSVLDEMEPAVAAAVTGSPRAGHLLRQLEQSKLFVDALEGPRPVYRYHQLFRDFLRSRVDGGALETTRWELERRAGAAYQQRGQHEQAIGHFLAAEAFDEAAQSLLAVADEALSRGRLYMLSGWIDRLPDSLWQAEPRLARLRDQLAAWQGASCLRQRPKQGRVRRLSRR